MATASSIPEEFSSAPSTFDPTTVHHCDNEPGYEQENTSAQNIRCVSQNKAASIRPCRRVSIVRLDNLSLSCVSFSDYAVITRLRSLPFAFVYFHLYSDLPQSPPPPPVNGESKPVTMSCGYWWPEGGTFL